MKNKRQEQRDNNSVEKMKVAANEEFDAGGVGVPNGRYFGMPFENSECPVVLISVPWDATVSYSEGTSDGPEAMIDASVQVDLYDEFIADSDTLKIGTDETMIDIKDNPEDESELMAAADYIKLLNMTARPKAKQVIDALAAGEEADAELIAEVNQTSGAVNYLVEQICSSYYKMGKIPGVVGGEHSVSYGAVKAAVASLNGAELGVLQFDAHADLRVAYEGFEHSHASVMYNIISTIPEVSKLCQVGLRDFCRQEHNLIRTNPKIKAFTDAEIAARLSGTDNWNNICNDIIESLPENVYISFDIDGLDPSLCPNTGTPVAGGLSFQQALILLRLVAKKRNIVGFDLCEVAPAASAASAENEEVAESVNEWDANVGARLLHKLSLFAAMGKSMK